MTVTDRADATEQEFRDRIAAFETAPTPPEVREAAVREQVIEAMSWAETFDDGRIGRDGAAELLDQYLAAYRATQDGGAEEAVDVNGCPDRQHHGVDCPGDACRYAEAER